MSYAYDYQGRRVRKTHYASLTTQCFTYDGDQIIADYNEAGVWKRRYYYGPGIDEPICMVRTPGIPSYVNYYHFDGLGSVVALSNNYGQLVEKYTYDVFGKPTIRNTQDEILTTSFYGNRYLFTGREYDSETGNYYYRARYYKPSIGRFLQPDPIGTYPEGGALNPFFPTRRHMYETNLYSYLSNNSVNGIDPSGMTGLTCAPCIGCITGTTAFCAIVCSPDCGEKTGPPDMDCMNACFKHILISIDSSSGRVWIVRIGCWAACAACALI